MYNLNNIKTLAADKKVSIKKIIEYCEISEGGFYKSIENQSMNIKTLDKIAEYLKVSVSELINDRVENVQSKGLKKMGVAATPVEDYEKETDVAKLYKIMFEQQVEITDLTRECESLKNVIALGRSANAG